MTDSRLAVLVVDDNRDISGLYCRLINGTEDLRCVGVLESADALVQEATRLRPGVVVLDLTMPGKPPLECVEELSQMLPDVRVLAFSGRDDPGTVDAVMSAGGWGLVSKNDAPLAVVEAIRRVGRGEGVFGGTRP